MARFWRRERACDGDARALVEADRAPERPSEWRVTDFGVTIFVDEETFQTVFEPVDDAAERLLRRPAA